MGNTSIANQFKSGKWRKIEGYPGYQVLQNIQTHMKVQKHFAKSDFDSFDDRYQNTELYNWRKSLDPRVNVVKLYQFEIKEQMFGIQQQQFVYTERVNRFSQRGKVFSKPEAFLLILDFLKGLELMFGVFGLFHTDVFLLGVSDEGKGKVWVNKNYAKNEVEEKNIIEEPGPNTELTLVNNLVTLVKDRVQNLNFMPEIQFPFNINIQQTIQYINSIRRQYLPFQVDKVYLNRSQFRQQYEKNSKRQVQLNQDKIFPLFKKSSASNQQFISPQKELIRHQAEINRSGQMVKKDPNETLSSDSNSRTKTDNINTIEIQKIQASKQPYQNERQIQVKKIHVQNKVPSNLNERRLISGFEREESYIARNDNQNLYFSQPILAQQPHLNQQPNIKQNIYLSQQLIPPTYMTPHHPTIEDRNRPYVLAQNPQFIQGGLPPINRVMQTEGQPEYFQRKVIKYRALNQAQIQRVFHAQNFNKQIYRDTILPQNHLIMQSHPVTNAPFSIQSTRIPSNIVTRSDPQYAFNQGQLTLAQFQNNNYVPQEEQGFINNVELCESVIFDRAQLQQNLADLQR